MLIYNLSYLGPFAGPEPTPGAWGTDISIPFYISQG
jgi:hypothetical protein